MLETKMYVAGGTFRFISIGDSEYKIHASIHKMSYSRKSE